MRLADLIIVFQLRGNDIDVGSFTNALQAIMRSNSRYHWSISPLRREIGFYDWAKSVTVTELKATVRRPNPNYKGRPDIRDFLEGPGAVQAEAKWKAGDGSGLDIEDHLIQQFVDHAYGKRYGSITARGRRDDAEVTFDKQGEERSQTVSADEETGDVGLEVLDQVLEREMEYATEDGG